MTEQRQFLHVLARDLLVWALTKYRRAQRVAAGGALDGETDGAVAKQTSEAAKLDKATKEVEPWTYFPSCNR